MMKTLVIKSLLLMIVATLLGGTMIFVFLVYFNLILGKGLPISILLIGLFGGFSLHGLYLGIQKFMRERGSQSN